MRSALRALLSSTLLAGALAYSAPAGSDRTAYDMALFRLRNAMCPSETRMTLEPDYETLNKILARRLFLEIIQSDPEIHQRLFHTKASENIEYEYPVDILDTNDPAYNAERAELWELRFKDI